jgi:bridging integrator 3
MSWPFNKSSSGSISSASASASTSTPSSDHHHYRSSINSSSSIAITGVIPRALQLDFDREEKKIQQFESNNKKFYKDVKLYVDKIEELNKSETKMINNLSNFTNQQQSSINTQVASNYSIENDQISSNDNDNEFLSRLQLWKGLLEENNKSCDQLKKSCQSQVIDPMKKLNAVFPNVYSSIKRRDYAYNDLIKQQSKLEKLQEKERSGANIVRIEELKGLVSTAKEQFHKEHLFLMEELPKLYNSRVDFIRPCVNSLLQSQTNFYDKYANFYDSILNCKENRSSRGSLNNNSNEQQQQQQQQKTIDTNLTTKQIEIIDNDIDKYISDIKSLSIVAGD